MRTCSFDGCTRKHDSQGLCGAHVQHFRKTGKIEKLPRDRTLDERFDLNTRPSNGCLLWTGGVRGDGYGGFSTPLKAPGRPSWLPKRLQVGAHQYALARSLGRWLKDQALHTCDTPLCVLPEHLYDGTQQDNARDWTERNPTTRGVAYGKSRLTIEDVRAARLGADPCEIAELRGVQVQTVEHARDGITWKWLDPVEEW